MKDIKKIKPIFTDARGEIFKLIDEHEKITSVLYLTCKKGAIRANHYHKKDTHYSYLIKGSMEYFYKDLNKSSRKKKTLVKAGEMVYTPSMVSHAMKFLEDSSFIALTTKPRDQKKYENDTVRVELIKNDK